MKTLPALLVALFLVGCSTFYQSVITITTVVDSAMKNWAALSVAGKTSPALDAQVTAAHDRYRAAAGVARNALIAYKNDGNQNSYVAALNAAKVAAQGVLDLITPLLSTSTGQTLNKQLANAKSL